jgi:glycosyltransferase involved in cell wall biosynthesis
VHLRGSNFRNFYTAAPFWLKPIIRIILEAVSILIVQDKKISKQFEGLIDKKRIHVVPNMIDIKRVDAAEPMDEKKKIILFVGHLSYAKGFYDLLCTVPRVIEECKDAQYWFLGERIDEEKNIMISQNNKKIEKANKIWRRFSDNIRSFGTVPNGRILAMMKSAKLLVLASYSEGFPMAVLEAMACGLPVVTTDVGALASLVKENINGYLIEPGDVEELGENIVRLLKDQDLQKKIGNNNKEYVRDRFSAEKVVPVFAGIFNKLD